MRAQYPGAIYHVMNRGDRRELIFKDDADRKRFLDTLTEVCEKTSWQVHAYCLMPNHFHLVVETPQPNLVAGMKWFLGTYTARFNRRHNQAGHLFGGRYKALIVDGSGSGYLRTVCDYVHLNPVRAKLLTPENPLSDYHWSSFCEYLKVPSKRPPWLRVDRLFGEMRIQQDDAPNRRLFAKAMEVQRHQEEPEEWTTVRKSWYFGQSALKEQLLEQMAGQVGQHHTGDEKRESDAQKAERLVAAELRKRHWTEDDLGTRRKTDPTKVKIAQRLRQETIMTLDWIAERLKMGCRHTLANCLKHQKLTNSRD